MDRLLTLGGRAVGVVGVLICVIAAIWRLLGNYNLAGFEVGTVLQVGTSAVVIGSFLLLLGRADRG